MENPEAYLDVLTIRSLKERYHGNTDNNTVSNINDGSCWDDHDDLEIYVRDFTIDDSISDCFADSDLDTPTVIGVDCRPSSKVHAAPTCVTPTAVPTKGNNVTSDASNLDQEITSSHKRHNLVISIFNKKSKQGEDTAKKETNSSKKRMHLHTKRDETNDVNRETSKLKHDGSVRPTETHGAKFPETYAEYARINKTKEKLSSHVAQSARDSYSASPSALKPDELYCNRTEEKEIENNREGKEINRTKIEPTAEIKREYVVENEEWKSTGKEIKVKKSSKFGLKALGNKLKRSKHSSDEDKAKCFDNKKLEGNSHTLPRENGKKQSNCEMNVGELSNTKRENTMDEGFDELFLKHNRVKLNNRLHSQSEPLLVSDTEWGNTLLANEEERCRRKSDGFVYSQSGAPNTHKVKSTDQSYSRGGFDNDCTGRKVDDVVNSVGKHFMVKKNKENLSPSPFWYEVEPDGSNGIKSLQFEKPTRHERQGRATLCDIIENSTAEKPASIASCQDINSYGEINNSELDLSDQRRDKIHANQDSLLNITDALKNTSHKKASDYNSLPRNNHCRTPTRPRVDFNNSLTWPKPHSTRQTQHTTALRTKNIDLPDNRDSDKGNIQNPKHQITTIAEVHESALDTNFQPNASSSPVINGASNFKSRTSSSLSYPQQYCQYKCLHSNNVADDVFSSVRRGYHIHKTESVIAKSREVKYRSKDTKPALSQGRNSNSREVSAQMEHGDLRRAEGSNPLNENNINAIGQHMGKEELTSLARRAATLGQTRCLLAVIGQSGHELINEVIDANGNTLLHLAAEAGCPGTVAILLSLASGPNRPNKNNLTPLQMALKNYNKNCLNSHSFNRTLCSNNNVDPNKTFFADNDICHKGVTIATTDTPEGKDEECSNCQVPVTADFQAVLEIFALHLLNQELIRRVKVTEDHLSSLDVMKTLDRAKEQLQQLVHSGNLETDEFSAVSTSLQDLLDLADMLSQLKSSLCGVKDPTLPTTPCRNVPEFTKGHCSEIQRILLQDIYCLLNHHPLDFHQHLHTLVTDRLRSQHFSDPKSPANSRKPTASLGNEQMNFEKLPESPREGQCRSTDQCFQSHLETTATDRRSWLVDVNDSNLSQQTKPSSAKAETFLNKPSPTNRISAEPKNRFVKKRTAGNDKYKRETTVGNADSSCAVHCHACSVHRPNFEDGVKVGVGLGDHQTKFSENSTNDVDLYATHTSTNKKQTLDNYILGPGEQYLTPIASNSVTKSTSHIKRDQLALGHEPTTSLKSNHTSSGSDCNALPTKSKTTQQLSLNNTNLSSACHTQSNQTSSSLTFPKTHHDSLEDTSTHKASTPSNTIKDSPLNHKHAASHNQLITANTRLCRSGESPKRQEAHPNLQKWDGGIRKGLNQFLSDTDIEKKETLVNVSSSPEIQNSFSSSKASSRGFSERDDDDASYDETESFDEEVDEGEDSEEDDDDHMYNRVKIDVEDDDLPDEALRIHRLHRHLQSVQKLHEHNDDVIETVVTGTGEILSHDPSPDLSHINIGEAYPFRTDEDAQAPKEKKSTRKKNTKNGHGSKESKKGPFTMRKFFTTRLFNHERVAAEDSGIRKITDNEFEETYRRRNDVIIRRRREMDEEIPWDQLEFSDSDDTEGKDNRLWSNHVDLDSRVTPVNSDDTDISTPREFL